MSTPAKSDKGRYNMFPNLIIIRTTNMKKEPLRNIAVMIKIFAKHKNDYYLIPSISNKDGIIELSQDWIKDQIEKDRKMFVMDYASTLEDCNSKIEIKVMDKDEVMNAIKARKLYQDCIDISEKEIDNLIQSENYNYLPISRIVEMNDIKIQEIELKLINI